MKMRIALLSVFAALTWATLWSQAPDFRARSRQFENEGLAQPYRGIFASSGKDQGLFRIEKTGVSTAPIRQAAEHFLQALTPEQREKTTFPVDDPEWRKWMNQHFYVRQGVGFNEMTEPQREAAFGLLKSTLSAEGFELARNIMRLNYTLGEMKNNFDEYGEWLYFLTVMGEPSADKPWGFQIDGHHLIVNCFVLGDQVVMTPTFVGSEPVIAPLGKYKGLEIMQAHQNDGLAMLESLDPSQRDKAVLEVSKTGNNNLGEAFHDNFDLDYAGLPVKEMSAKQKKQLLALAKLYLDIQEPGHAHVKVEEVEKYLDRTYFAWIGGSGPDAVFYYRIHSPVVLIEFDHQNPAGLRDRYPERKPIREHIHAVIRTPNGNDYGKDLLRQHYEQSHRAAL
ncbi:MAG: DUF3500 domain-containing protein [Acidobacteria bacterium]|nr:DUF3500 domain-containing protein [Acidobacteriota bacterium]